MKLGKFFAAIFVMSLFAPFLLINGQGKSLMTETRTEAAAAAVPQYQIIDLGVEQAGDSSQGMRSSAGGVAVGRSLRSAGSTAFAWDRHNGWLTLTNLTGRNFCVSNGANELSFAVGTCATTSFGSGRLPVIWQSGSPMPLPLPSGETLGDANDINDSGVAVGSANAGSQQFAVIFSNGTGTPLSQTTAGGAFFRTAFAINNTGRIVGQGVDPGNAARNVGIVYDMGGSNAFEVGALPGKNGALAFDVSNAGHVVGASMQNQGSGVPYIWTQAGGMIEIPLPAGTSSGSARGVNSNGWAVGTASSNFAIPFLYDGTNTYRVQDLLPAGSGWDLSMNTSSSAMGISDDGVIIGTGVIGGQVHAYALVPVANVMVGGRILSTKGAGVRGALVTISGGNLTAPLTVQTGNFGYYNFDGLQSGQTYTVSVEARRSNFDPSSRTVTPQANITDLDFVAH